MYNSVNVSIHVHCCCVKEQLLNKIKKKVSVVWTSFAKPSKYVWFTQQNKLRKMSLRDCNKRTVICHEM